MTDWIHALALEWGHWMRRLEAEGSLVRGTLGRIMEQGPEGAAIHTEYGSRPLPVRDMPKRVQAFHHAWLSLEDRYRAVLWAEYKLRMKIRRKCQACGLTRSNYYRERARARQIIGQKLEEKA